MQCKTSLIQAKNPFVNTILSKINFFTVDLRETSCKIFGEKSIKEGTLLTDGFFAWVELVLHHNQIRQFGLGKFWSRLKWQQKLIKTYHDMSQCSTMMSPLVSPRISTATSCPSTTSLHAIMTRSAPRLHISLTNSIPTGVSAPVMRMHFVSKRCTLWHSLPFQSIILMFWMVSSFFRNRKFWSFSIQILIHSCLIRTHCLWWY